MPSSHLHPVIEKLESRRLFAAGVLDPAFNHGALVSTEFAGGSSVICAMVTLPDGSILAAGTVRLIEGNTPTDKTKLLLAKYRFDGSLDPSFGDGGRIVNTPRSMTGGVRLGLTPDGGFLVMGSANTNADGRDSHDHLVVTSFGSTPIGTSEMLLKFTATGKVDTSFAKNGVLRPDNMDSFTVDPQGRILVGGFRDSLNQPASSEATDATLTRYTASGALDTTFNQTGQFVSLAPIIPAEDNRYQSFNSIAIDSAGRILAGMEVFDTTGGDEDGMAYAFTQVFRLSEAGEVDAGYTGANIDRQREIAGVLEDGSMFLVGKTIARVTPTGQLDTTYGNSGLANTTKIGLTLSNNLYLRLANDRYAVMADGSIIFANVATPGVLELTRINPQGQPDASFGTAGTLAIATDSDPDAMGYIAAVDLAPDGSVVFGGQSGILTPTSADTRTAVVGRLLTAAGPSVQLVPRTLTNSAQSLYITAWIRDPQGINLGTLDEDDLKFIDDAGGCRRLRFVSSEDVNGDGTFIAARYRIAGAGGSSWSSANNGVYEIHLQDQEIADSAGTASAAAVLGMVYVKIA